MKNYQGFLIDLDGTVYKGTEKIIEAIEFVKELERKGLPYLFLTNNSTKHPKDVSEKLVNMGVPSTAKHVFTTSMATASYIKGQKKRMQKSMQSVKKDSIWRLRNVGLSS